MVKCSQETTDTISKLIKEPIDYIMASQSHYVTYRKHIVMGRNQPVTHRIPKGIVDEVN